MALGSFFSGLGSRLSAAGAAGQNPAAYYQAQQDRQAAEQAAMAQQKQLSDIGRIMSGAEPPEQKMTRLYSLGTPAAMEQANAIASQIAEQQDISKNYKVVGGSLVDLRNPTQAVYQGQQQLTPYEAATLGLKQMEMQQRGEITPYQQEMLDIQRQKIAADMQPKALPMSALKERNRLVDEMSTAQNITTDLSEFKQKIDSGDLNLGAITNIVNKAQNMIGLSDKESRNFAAFEATLIKLRNDSLRLNKGVQTEGDAQRAWDELINNINDEGVVKTQLDRIMRINQRAEILKQGMIEDIDANYGRAPKQSQSSDVLTYNPETGMLE